MAYVYADMDAMAGFQQLLIQHLPQLEQQVDCKEDLIKDTIQKIQAAIERAIEAEEAARKALEAAEERLREAEALTRERNAHLGEDEEPVTTPSFYYEDVEECQQAYDYAQYARQHAENTLENFKSYVRSHRQQQADGIEHFKKLLGMSGKFFERYIRILVDAKKATALGGDGSTTKARSGSESTSGGADGGIAAATGPAASVKEAGRQWTQGLSKEQYAALSMYTGAAYANINGALRGLDTFQPGYRELAVQIHGALSGSCIPQNCTVYRGASGAALGALRNLPDDQLVGAFFSDDGFMSTSLNSEDAFGGEIKLVISVPAGAKGAYVGYLSQLGHSESEVLFDMGQVLQITKAERDSNGRRVIHARMMV